MPKQYGTFYIRLLSYDQACEAERYFTSLDSDTMVFAYITVGGLACQGVEYKPEMKKYLDEKGWRYQFSQQHPDKVHKQIIQEFKGLN